jgi:hypothetical protein
MSIFHARLALQKHGYAGSVQKNGFRRQSNLAASQFQKGSHPGRVGNNSNSINTIQDTRDAQDNQHAHITQVRQTPGKVHRDRPETSGRIVAAIACRCPESLLGTILGITRYNLCVFNDAWVGTEPATEVFSHQSRQLSSLSNYEDIRI